MVEMGGYIIFVYFLFSVCSFISVYTVHMLLELLFRYCGSQSSSKARFLSALLLGNWRLLFLPDKGQERPTLLFTDNVSAPAPDNSDADLPTFTKDAFHKYVVQGSILSHVSLIPALSLYISHPHPVSVYLSSPPCLQPVYALCNCMPSFIFYDYE